MKTTRQQGLVSFIIFIVIGLVSTFNVLAGEAVYYYVGDKKVQLAPSESVKAFAMKSNVSPSKRDGFEANVQRAGIGEVERSPLLEKYGVVVIRSKENVGASAFRSGMEALSHEAEVENEVPVYDIGKANAVLVNEFLVQFQSNLPESAIKDFLKAQGAQVVKKNEKIPNRYTITFEGISPQEALVRSSRIHQETIIKFSEPLLISIIKARPRINNSAPLTVPSSPSAASPTPSATNANDPFYSMQWGLHNTGANSVGVADADIDAPEAWDHQVGTDGVIVAIIDEGVDTQHEDLRDKIVTPYDATDGDNDQEPQYCAGHGTSCAGIAAAMGNNGLGMAGVSWRAKIMPIRIATVDNCALPSHLQSWVTNSAIIEDGIRTAVNRGADVLSNSWGGGSPSNAINSAIDYAIAQNRVVVFAAGNDSGPVDYPASLSMSKMMITVSATNEFDEFKTKTGQDGETWWGSNFGTEVNISAPGVHIMTTDISGSDGYDSGDYVATFNGTSSATPFVAGAAALILSENPSRTPAEVRELLQSHADDLGAPGFDHQFGHGRLNVARVMEALAQMAVVPAPDLIGLHKDQAEIRLNEVGLTKGNESLTHHPTVSENFVISQAPTEGTSLNLGDAVDLVVSRGPEESEEPPQGKTIPLSPPLTEGSISEPGMVEHFQFQVAHQGSYLIETNGTTPNMDTVMSLFGPDNPQAFIEENDDIETGNFNSRIVASLQPGTYQVHVRHYFSTKKGNFTIRVQAP